MYSTEQRRAAIETFIKFDHSYADTIAELGYPNRHTLNNWWREYKATGEVPIAKAIREPRFSDEQKREAVEHYLGHGKRLKRTMKALGYPKSRMTLCEWIDELAPGQRKYRGPNPKRDSVPIEKKVQVVAELEARTGPAAEIAEKHGVSRAAPYVWRREIMGDNGGEPEKKGEPVSKEYDDLPDDIGQLHDMLRETKMQLRAVQLELEVRQATFEIVKKDPGAEPGLLTNAEKAAMVTALRPRGASIGSARSCRSSAWPRAATSTRGTPRPGARPRSMRPPGGPLSRRSRPAAAHTATGACTRRSTRMRSLMGQSASGPCAAS